MKTYLIDGYNLLLTQKQLSSGYSDLQSRRDHLLSLLKSLAIQQSCRIVIYFEGNSPQVSSQKVHRLLQVFFLKNRVEADEELKKKIRRLSARDETIIVTSDREIQFCARDHSIPFLSGSDFIQEMHRAPAAGRLAAPNKSNPRELPSQKAEPNLSRSEVDGWLKIFKEKSPNEDT